MSQKQLKREQHILPKCYLKRWLDRIPNRNPVIWVNSKDGSSQSPKTLGNSLFWREFFYDLASKDGQHDQSVEEALHDTETRFSLLIDKQISRKEPLDRQQARVMDLFAASMSLRTLGFNEKIESFAAAKAHIEAAHARLYGISPPDTDLRRKNAFPMGIVCNWTWLADHLANWNHNLLLAPGGKSFITSDNPCVWFSDVGLACLENDFLEISLPLTPRHLLLISRTLPQSGCGETSGDTVDYFNRRTIRQCHRYWICRTKTAGDWKGVVH
jgi:Protein of unknown function (DUF4238)